MKKEKPQQHKPNPINPMFQQNPEIRFPVTTDPHVAAAGNGLKSQLDEAARRRLVY